MSDRFIPPELVPPGVNDKRSRDFVDAFGARLASFSTSSVLVQDAWTVPAELLPAMLIETGMSEFVSPGMREEHIRALIADAPAIHAMTGTVAGVRRAFAALNVSIDWVQWWQQDPPGYHDTHVITAYLSEAILDGEDVLTSPQSRAALFRVLHATQRWSQEIALQLGFRGNFEDAIDIAEADEAQIAAAHEDAYDWGLRYDGKALHDHAVQRRHNAAIRYDAAALYNGWRTLEAGERPAAELLRRRHDASFTYSARADHSGWTRTGWDGPGALYDNQRDLLETGLWHEAADRAGVLPLHDAIYRHDSLLTYGGNQPSSFDPVMPIIVTRQQRHDGRYRHGGDHHDAAIRYSGARRYPAGTPSSGSTPTHLTAQ